MKKNIVFTVLALVLATTAFAQTAADFKVTPTADGAGVVITGYTGRVIQVQIPAEIQGKPVREIGKGAFAGNAAITSVVIPQGVTKIGNSAFQANPFGEASKLASVTLPEGITEIGDFAFANCALTAVTLPDSLTTIGNYAFQACFALATITIPETVEKISFDSYSFSGCPKLTPESQSALKRAGYTGSY